MSSYYTIQREYDNMRAALKPLKKLMRAHNRQCENECNGEGYIPRKGFFRLDSQDGYVSPDVSVFDAEIDRLEKEIYDLCVQIFGPGKFELEFQRDPRGYTVIVREIFNGQPADITTLIMFIKSF